MVHYTTLLEAIGKSRIDGIIDSSTKRYHEIAVHPTNLRNVRQLVPLTRANDTTHGDNCYSCRGWVARDGSSMVAWKSNAPYHVEVKRKLIDEKTNLPVVGRNWVPIYFWYFPTTRTTVVALAVWSLNYDFDYSEHDAVDAVRKFADAYARYMGNVIPRDNLMLNESYS